MLNKVPQNLNTPHEISDNACVEIAQALNPLVADSIALYVKTKNFHWHVSGTHFRDYHLLLDEQADQVFAMVDILAERVRKLGQVTIRSIKDIQTLKTIEDTEELLDAKNMLKTLLNDNKKFLKHLKLAHEVCSKHEDFGSTSLLENFIDETERRIWFLFETIS